LLARCHWIVSITVAIGSFIRYLIGASCCRAKEVTFTAVEASDINILGKMDMYNGIGFPSVAIRGF
jgi:hypothetical protein